jgi:aldehyde:ferredoxin oxidoreductase
MGSKNLKAIVARGDRKITVANEKMFDGVKERIRLKIANNGIEKALNAYGTGVLVNIINESYVHPTHNFLQQIKFPARRLQKPC